MSADLKRKTGSIYVLFVVLHDSCRYNKSLLKWTYPLNIAFYKTVTYEEDDDKTGNEETCVSKTAKLFGNAPSLQNTHEAHSALVVEERNRSLYTQECGFICL